MELVQILNLIKAGETPTSISKDHNIPKSTLSYSISKLKKLGCIEKLGYGVWEYKKEVPIVPKDNITTQIGTSKKQIRGHAYIWNIRFLEQINWEKRIKNSTLKYKMICHKKVFRILYKSRKIWLTRKGMIIYEPIDFLGKSSFTVKGTAVFEMDRLIKDLLIRLKQEFIPYQFTTSREHYAMIKNELARQYNDKKEKLFIRNQEGTIWLWIDDSKGLNELETNDPKLSKEVQDWYNNHKKHHFKVTPDFLLNAILQNTKNLDYHAENFRSHLEINKQIANTQAELVNEVKKLSGIIKEMKEKKA